MNAGLRYEFATLPEDVEGRDSTLVNLPTRAHAWASSTRTRPASLSPRLGFAWDAPATAAPSVRGGYGLYFNTNNQQNLIVTVTNPPATPRAIIANPTFPTPPFERGVAQLDPARSSGTSRTRASTSGT